MEEESKPVLEQVITSTDQPTAEEPKQESQVVEIKSEQTESKPTEEGQNKLENTQQNQDFCK